MRDDGGVRSFSFIPRALVLLLSLAFASKMACGQNTEADLSARLIGKPLYLKGFWMEDRLNFDATGQPARKYRTGSFTESGFQATSVKLSGSTLRVTGARILTTFSNDGVITRRALPSNLSRPEKLETITIDVDVKSGQDFGPALDAVFSDGLAGLTALLPACWQSYATQRFPDPPDAPPAKRINVNEKGVMHIGGGVRPPTILNAPYPEYSDAARRLKFSGDVEGYLWVGADGLPSHIAIAKPVGIGLDEKACESLSHYTFRPATKDGKPIQTDLYIDVNFQIF